MSGDLSGNEFGWICQSFLGLRTGYDFGPFQDPNFLAPAWNMKFFNELQQQSMPRLIEHGRFRPQCFIPGQGYRGLGVDDSPPIQFLQKIGAEGASIYGQNNLGLYSLAKHKLRLIGIEDDSIDVLSHFLQMYLQSRKSSKQMKEENQKVADLIRVAKSLDNSSKQMSITDRMLLLQSLHKIFEEDPDAPRDPTQIITEIPDEFIEEQTKKLNEERSALAKRFATEAKVPPIKAAAKDTPKPKGGAQMVAKDVKAPAKDAEALAKSPAKDAKAPAKAPAKDAKSPAKDAKAPAKDAKAVAKDAEAPAKDAKTVAKDAKAPAKTGEPSKDPTKSLAVPPNASLPKFKFNELEWSILRQKLLQFYVATNTPYRQMDLTDREKHIVEYKMKILRDDPDLELFVEMPWEPIVGRPVPLETTEQVNVVGREKIESNFTEMSTMARYHHAIEKGAKASVVVADKSRYLELLEHLPYFEKNRKGKLHQTITTLDDLTTSEECEKLALLTPTPLERRRAARLKGIPTAMTLSPLDQLIVEASQVPNFGEVLFSHSFAMTFVEQLVEIKTPLLALDDALNEFVKNKSVQDFMTFINKRILPKLGRPNRLSNTGRIARATSEGFKLDAKLADHLLSLKTDPEQNIFQYLGRLLGKTANGRKLLLELKIEGQKLRTSIREIFNLFKAIDTFIENFQDGRLYMAYICADGTAPKSHLRLFKFYDKARPQAESLLLLKVQIEENYSKLLSYLEPEQFHRILNSVCPGYEDEQIERIQGDLDRILKIEADRKAAAEKALRDAEQAAKLAAEKRAAEAKAAAEKAAADKAAAEAAKLKLADLKTTKEKAKAIDDKIAGDAEGKADAPPVVPPKAGPAPPAAEGKVPDAKTKDGKLPDIKAKETPNAKGPETKPKGPETKAKDEPKNKAEVKGKEDPKATQPPGKADGPKKAAEPKKPAEDVKAKPTVAPKVVAKTLGKSDDMNKAKAALAKSNAKLADDAAEAKTKPKPGKAADPKAGTTSQPIKAGATAKSGDEAGVKKSKDAKTVAGKADSKSSAKGKTDLKAIGKNESKIASKGKGNGDSAAKVGVEADVEVKGGVKATEKAATKAGAIGKLDSKGPQKQKESAKAEPKGKADPKSATKSKGEAKAALKSKASSKGATKSKGQVKAVPKAKADPKTAAESKDGTDAAPKADAKSKATTTSTPVAEVDGVSKAKVVDAKGVGKTKTKAGGPGKSKDAAKTAKKAVAKGAPKGGAEAAVKPAKSVAKSPSKSVKENVNAPDAGSAKAKSATPGKSDLKAGKSAKPAKTAKPSKEPKGGGAKTKDASIKTKSAKSPGEAKKGAASKSKSDASAKVAKSESKSKASPTPGKAKAAKKA